MVKKCPKMMMQFNFGENKLIKILIIKITTENNETKKKKKKVY